MHVHVNFLLPFVPAPFSKPQLFANQIYQMSSCCMLTTRCAAEKDSRSAHERWSPEQMNLNLWPTPSPHLTPHANNRI